MGNKIYETLPPGYYDERANQRINWPLHWFGRTVLRKFMERQQGSKLHVVSTESVRAAAKDDRPIMVLPSHRSSYDIGFFVEATQQVGIDHVRPISKLENIQSRAKAGFYHRVGLVAIEHGDNFDLDAVDSYFARSTERGQNGLFFPEEHRITEDIMNINVYKRTAAMMAIKHGYRVVSLAIVGGGTGETHIARDNNLIKRKTHKDLWVPTMPVAQFGEIIDLPHEPDASFRELTRLAGPLVRTTLRPDLQQTMDAAYATRAELLDIAA